MAMYLEVTLHAGGGADALARDLVSDLRSSRQIAGADLVTRPARAGEKGIVEELGSVAVSLMGAGGAEVLMFCLRGLFPRMTAPPDGGEKTIRIQKGGDVVELRGAMSDADFRAATDRVLALLEKG